MSGIYVHIPFCKQKCSYCDFHFSTNQRLKSAMVDALCLEMSMRTGELPEPPKSIYFGGGTPSMLNEAQLQQLVDALHRNFDLSGVREFTLETNPDDHRPDQLRAWRQLGVNRLSIGVQSFHDRDLSLMNRAHSAAHAAQCVQQAREAGFESLSMDLIYGVPDQSLGEWETNIRTALSLNAEHISAYCLTIEERTALHHQVRTGALTEKSEEDIEREYQLLHELLTAHGYEHYELSNFARSGHHALHNSQYWEGAAYLGIGPSAHSFDGCRTRSWNVANNPEYIRALTSGKRPHSTEVTSEQEHLNELIMTGLRRVKGLVWSELSSSERALVEQQYKCLNASLQRVCECDDAGLRMNPRDWLVSDAVIRALMLVD